MVDPAGNLPPSTQDLAAVLEEATRRHQQGDLAGAERLYEAIRSQDGRHFTATHLLGLLRRQRGDAEGAVQLIGEALALSPRSALAHLNLGIALLDLRRFEEALLHFQMTLVLKPNDRDGLINRAIALRELGRFEEALSFLDEAMACHGPFPEALLNRSILLTDLERPAEALDCIDLIPESFAQYPKACQARGNALRSLCRFDEALASYDQALAGKTDFLEVLLNRATTLLDLKRPGEALAGYEACFSLQPDNAAVLLALGNALVELDRREEALARFDQVLARQPDLADALYNRGRLLQSMERLEEALADYDRVLALQPDRSDALINRATVLHHMQRHLQALQGLSAALTLHPDSLEALANSGLILMDLGRAKEALAIFNRILEREPDNEEAILNRGSCLLLLQQPREALANYGEYAPKIRNAEALLNRGVALHQLGRHEEAMASYDEALRAKPDYPLASSNRIFLLDYLPEVDFSRHQEERRNYFLAHARGLLSPAASHPNDRDPSRRLVIGYVSADFRQHSAAACFGPVLRRHDRSKFKVICYSGVLAEDEWTREFRQSADAWRVVSNMSDVAFAELIRKDRIDILVDLSGHSKGNRLLVFARKPAPVQVTAWGHTGGTGLPTVDYQFTDPVLVPPEVRPLFAETSYDLPCAITFEAPPFAPAVSELPARHKGFITFGSLNRLNKTTPAALALWARILRSVPGSRLLLKDVALDEPPTRLAIQSALQDHGIPPDRTDLRGYSDRRSHLAVYGEVDIALDPFPQNGGITTWEAQWMGGPVVALLTARPACRISAAILHALGLEEWVSEDEAGYLELAVAMANDLDALARFRGSARERILNAPAGNPETYTRAVESAYRCIWERWCAQQGSAADPETMLAKAIAAHERGDLASAQRGYEAILSDEPRHFAATHLLGLVKGKLGEHQEAVRILGDALELNPRSALAHLHRGIELRSLDRAGEALTHFRRALFLHPGQPEALMNCALALHDLGRNREALDSLDRLLEIQPGNAEALLNRGILLRELHRPVESLAALQRALAADPANPAVPLNLGIALTEMQRPGEAIGWFDQALSQQPGLADTHFHRAVALLAGGRLDEALASCQRALELRPGWTAALVNCAAVLHRTGRLEESLACLEQALAGKPDLPEAILNRGMVLRELGRPAEALACFERLLTLQPGQTEAHQNRAKALRDLERRTEALASLEQALALDPDHAGALMDHALALLDLRRSTEALVSIEQALRLLPEDPGALTTRGTILLNLGRPEAALADYDRALAVEPDHPEALLNRGTVLLELKRPAEALACYDQALVRRPEWVDALMNRGTALVALNRMDEALASYDLALLVQPGHVEALTNRGTALHRLGQHREAVAGYDSALALKPAHLKALSNKIFVLDYLPEVDFAAHQQARRDYCQALTQGHSAPAWAGGGPRNTGSPLVLGYVSADFKRHSAASCFGPVLFNHDHSAFRVICYSGTTVEDDWTQRFRDSADLWRPSAGLSDEELANLIRADRVDILVDLSGHSEGNRLPVFALKPAPIQITAWGHCGGTGLAAMDIQFTDPVLIPPEVRGLFAETSVDLPCCITFAAPEYAPPVAEPPSLANGFVTFGSLSRFMKAAPEVLDLWARILLAVPQSRLLLKDALLDDPRLQAEVRDRFQRQGIAPERILLRGFSSHQEHLATHSEVDIVLDTFPQNGGITVWEALWMGVPVVAMLGNKPPSRLSAAILHALGLDEWVSTSIDGYLRKAIEAAADLDSLARFRSSIRALIMASAAGNPRLYTGAVEAAYRTLWNQRLCR